MMSTRSLWTQLLFLVVIITVCVFPFYWMVTTSLKTQIVALEAPPVWIFDPTFDNYREALFEDGVLRTLINSLVIAISTTLLALIIGVPAAFALARFEFRGKKDRWFVIWIVTDQFRGIPYDLDEAARLEGASQFTIMRKICLPLAMPGVAVSAIFSFIFSWNELMFGLILTRTEAKTAPAMAVSFMEGYNLPYGKIMATSTLIVIPVLIFALIASQQLVRGLTMGAVK